MGEPLGILRAGPGGGAGFSPAARIEGRLATLKAELNITANQESAWQAFANQAKAQAATMQAHRAAVTAAQAAPDRLAQRAAFAKQRAANLDTMSAAVKDLYEALTPEQKAIADQRMAFGGGMGGPGGPKPPKKDRDADLSAADKIAKRKARLEAEKARKRGGK